MLLYVLFCLFQKLDRTLSVGLFELGLGFVRCFFLFLKQLLRRQQFYGGDHQHFFGFFHRSLTTEIQPAWGRSRALNSNPCATVPQSDSGQCPLTRKNEGRSAIEEGHSSPRPPSLKHANKGRAS